MKVSILNLEERNKRIDELLAKDKLTYTEKGELEELQKITKELLLQKDIEERRAAAASKETADKTVDAYNKQYGNYDSYSVEEWLEQFNTVGITPVSGGDNNIAGTIATYVKATEQLAEAQQNYENAVKNGEDVTWLSNDIKGRIDYIDDVSQVLDTKIGDLQEKRILLEEEYNKAIEKQKNISGTAHTAFLHS